MLARVRQVRRPGDERDSRVGRARRRGEGRDARGVGRRVARVGPRGTVSVFSLEPRTRTDVRHARVRNVVSRGEQTARVGAPRGRSKPAPASAQTAPRRRLGRGGGGGGGGGGGFVVGILLRRRASADRDYVRGVTRSRRRAPHARGSVREPRGFGRRAVHGGSVPTRSTDAGWFGRAVLRRRVGRFRRRRGRIGVDGRVTSFRRRTVEDDDVDRRRGSIRGRVDGSKVHAGGEVGVRGDGTQGVQGWRETRRRRQRRGRGGRGRVRSRVGTPRPRGKAQDRRRSREGVGADVGRDVAQITRRLVGSAHGVRRRGGEADGERRRRRDAFGNDIRERRTIRRIDGLRNKIPPTRGLERYSGDVRGGTSTRRDAFRIRRRDARDGGGASIVARLREPRRRVVRDATTPLAPSRSTRV